MQNRGLCKGCGPMLCMARPQVAEMPQGTEDSTVGDSRSPEPTAVCVGCSQSTVGKMNIVHPLSALLFSVLLFSSVHQSCFLMDC
jgi:hypothetical protein